MRTLASIFVGLVAGSIFVLLLYLILRPKGPKKISLILQDAEDVERQTPPVPSSTDDLEKIRGIGPAYARRLNEAGIQTYPDLAKASPSRLADIIGPRARSANIEEWISEAQRLK